MPNYLAKLEKNPYRFANYSRATTPAVFFPGCSFTSFYPKSTKWLVALFAQHDVGVLYECCSLPVDKMGLSADATRNITQVQQKLHDLKVVELIVACPNCYYYMKDHLDIAVVSVYSKLQQLNIKPQQLDDKQLKLFLPCPDRVKQELRRDIESLGQVETTNDFAGAICCGLGLPPELNSPKILQPFLAKVSLNQVFYTYCASCTGLFNRRNIHNISHILPAMLGINEQPCKGILPIFNRLKKRFVA